MAQDAMMVMLWCYLGYYRVSQPGQCFAADYFNNPYHWPGSSCHKECIYKLGLYIKSRASLSSSILTMSLCLVLTSVCNLKKSDESISNPTAETFGLALIFAMISVSQPLYSVCPICNWSLSLLQFSHYLPIGFPCRSTTKHDQELWFERRTQRYAY